MKTGLKIVLIAVGAAAAVSTVLIAGFSGLPSKKRAVEQYGETLGFAAEAYPYADLEAPADYVSCKQQSVSLMMPADLEPMSTDPENIRSNIYVNEAKTAMVMVEKPFDYGTFSLA